MAERAGEILVHADPEALARGAAEWLCAAAIAASGNFSVCLAGGSTPKRLYELLSGPGIRERFPWQRVHWFWGDERFVPPTDPQSNYRMAQAAMLSRAPVPAENIHPVPTEGTSPAESAAAYERALQAFYGASGLDPRRPLFDVTLLGLGEDGHTASLFPGISALDERQRWVVAVTGAKPEARISLTFPTLDASRDIAFLVAGATKRAILAKVRCGEEFPAARIKPLKRLLWFVDRAAAGDGD
jgi:6-phosphogluconolactonase